MIDQTIPSPCYVLDEKLFRKNLSLIRRVSQESGAEVILAFKAFSLWPLFPIVREYVDTATASSLHEARLCFEEMKNLAHTYSPLYSDADFDEILTYSSHVTFNSIAQAEHYLSKVSENGIVSAGLRINPEYSEVETDLYNPCSPGSRLGVLSSDIGTHLPNGIEGLHFHTLCESRSHNLEATLSRVIEKFGHLFAQIKWLNMGGGHLMTHSGYDVEHLIQVLKNFKLRFPHIHLILEPGSAFAWESGVLVATVGDIVQNKGITTAIIDASFTCHMPDCLEMPYKPKIRNAYQEPVAGKPTYRIGGNSCLAGDFLGFWSFDEPLKVGTQIIFEDMIHYTLVKTTMFNGVPHPAIGMITADDKFKLIRSFGYEDYKQRMG